MADINERLTELKADLASVQAAIAAAEKEQKYSFDDGQGKQSVERPNLQFLYAERKRLREEIDYLEAVAADNSTSFYGRPS